MSKIFEKIQNFVNVVCERPLISYFVDIQVMRSVMFHILNIIWNNMNPAFLWANAKQSISAKPAIADLQGDGIAHKDLELQKLLVGKCGVSR